MFYLRFESPELLWQLCRQSKESFPDNSCRRYAERCQILVLFFSEISHGISADVFEVIWVAVAFYYLSVKSMDRFLSEKILCDVEDISALVTVFRKFERLILEFVASRLNTDGPDYESGCRRRCNKTLG